MTHGLLAALALPLGRCARVIDLGRASAHQSEVRPERGQRIVDQHLGLFDPLIVAAPVPVPVRSMTASMVE
jgi:hypothetical protein